jgi:hypothetical protein
MAVTISEVSVVQSLSLQWIPISDYTQFYDC